MPGSPSIRELFRLDGKRALVTGAGRGLGASIAEGLAEMGADLFLTSRTESELIEVSGRVRALGRRAHHLAADLSRLDDTRAVVESALDALGGIDILVNVAGTSHPQPAVEVSEEDWNRTMDLNLKGTFFLTQAVGRHMVNARYGKVITVSSHLGLVGLPKRVVYGVSKAGLIHMTRILALEWAPYGINVNGIAPCYTRTKLAWNVLGDGEFRRFVEERTPLGGIGEPIDLVGAVVYLASEASRRMTGQTLLIDGGWCLQ